MFKRTEVKQEPVPRRNKSGDEESQEERLRGINLSDLAKQTLKWDASGKGYQAGRWAYVGRLYLAFVSQF